jgi:hypothetical protein
MFGTCLDAQAACVAIFGMNEQCLLPLMPSAFELADETQARAFFSRHRANSENSVRAN